MTWLVILMAFAVLGVLATGVVSMLKGGDFNAKYGNRLMQLRVLFQAATLVLIVILLMTAGGKG